MSVPAGLSFPRPTSPWWFSLRREDGARKPFPRPERPGEPLSPGRPRRYRSGGWQTQTALSVLGGLPNARASLAHQAARPVLTAECPFTELSRLGSGARSLRRDIVSLSLEHRTAFRDLLLDLDAPSRLCRFACPLSDDGILRHTPGHRSRLRRGQRLAPAGSRTLPCYLLRSDGRACRTGHVCA